MKKYITILFAAITSMSAFAHTDLASSVPNNNAMLMKSPEMIEVTFDDSVRLVNLLLVNSKEETIEIDFAPTMDASETFSYALPSLAPDTYKASWTIMGEDGHKMKGDFSFMVHAMDNMKGMHDIKDMKDKKMDHKQHNEH